MTGRRSASDHLEQRVRAAAQRLTVPVDLDRVLQRVEAELSRPLARRSIWRRLAVACLALLVAGGGVLVLTRTLGRSVPPGDAPRDHYIRLAVGPYEQADAGHRVRFETNLPEGTLVDSYASAKEMEGPSPCCAAVRDGMVLVELANNNCHRRDGELHGSIWQLRLTASPLIPSDIHSCPVFATGCPPPPTPQPAGVYEALGRHFERLRGDQVIIEGRDRKLVATVRVAFPAETCVANPGIGGEGFGPLQRCPDVNGTRSIGPDDARSAEAAALEHAPTRWAVRGSRSGRDNGFITRQCGEKPARLTWIVTVYPLDEPDSASLQTDLYMVRRAEGWEIYASY